MKRYKTQLGIQLEWQGKAENEVGIISAIDKSVIPDSARPDGSEIGDPESQPVASKLNSNEDGSINKDFPLFQDSNIPSVSVGDTVIAIDPNYYRPTEVDLLIGDPSKAKEKLGWEAGTKLEKLVTIMVQSDLQKVLIKGY